MMSVILPPPFERDWEIFREAFAGPQSLPMFGNVALWSWMLATAGMLLAAWAMWSLVRRDRAALGPANRRVCAGMGIGRRERRLLHRVARAAGMRHVAALLISEGCYEYAAGHYARSHGSGEKLRELRARIFDD